LTLEPRPKKVAVGKINWVPKWKKWVPTGTLLNRRVAKNSFATLLEPRADSYKIFGTASV
jgi:hypothetical protein